MGSPVKHSGETVLGLGSSLHSSPGSSVPAPGAKRGNSCWCCTGSQAGLTCARPPLIAFAFEKGLNPAILIPGRTSIKGDPQVLICFHEKRICSEQFSQAVGPGGVHSIPSGTGEGDKGI